MRRLLVLAVALAAGCSRPSAKRDAAPIAGAQPRSDRVLLTGELDAVASETVIVPRTPRGSVALRWLEVDGTRVTKGQKVAELDNSAFANNLAEQKLTAVQTESDLAASEAQNDIQAADKRFDVDKARIALAKAKAEASIAEDTVTRRQYQEKQLEKQRAEVALAKAIDDLAAQTKAAALDIQVRKIALDKSKRDIAVAEAAIESVALRAPSDGIFVIAEHPWEGRKLEVGDNVWIGMSVARLPDLGKMKVNAFLSDVDDGRVAVGMRANAILDAYPELVFPGTITDVSPVAREPSQHSFRRSFLVTMALERTDPRMLPGMSVRVEIAK